MKRVFEIDITLCPLCGGQLHVIADVTDPGLIRKIFDTSTAEQGTPVRCDPIRF